MATLFDARPEAGPRVKGIEIIVPGRPVAQPRHRSSSQLASANALWAAAKSAKSPQHLRQLLSRLVTTRVYLPKDDPVIAYKQAIRLKAMSLFRGVPWEGPVFMELVFLMPRPQSKIWKTRSMPRYPHTSVPDRDNIAKACKDALNGVAYRDDSQVCAGPISKWVCSGDENPKTIIKLARIETA
jgi:Holliday junction resolvase RusA-like endonuclease